MIKCECGIKVRNVRTWPFNCMCGRRHAGPEGVVVTPKKEPGTLAKVVSFCTEKAKWLAAGMPERTQEQQAECLATCGQCEHFDAAKVKCLECGCNLTDAVKMATKRCPLGKWSTNTGGP